MAIRFIKPRVAKGLSGQKRVPSIRASFDDDVQRFRDLAFAPGTPLKLRYDNESTFPAIKKWFCLDETLDNEDPPGRVAYSRYLYGISKNNPYVEFPYELVYPQHRPGTHGEAVTGFCETLCSSGPEHAALAEIVQRNIPSSAEDVRLLRFTAPLALLLAARDFNITRPGAMQQLYIAQASLNDLPVELQNDLPTPKSVKHAGKGDVYDSSLWLGLEPTFTPWHRDPNPNLFCQLCGSKTIRLLPPYPGEQIFREVQLRLGQHGSSRIRGAEMMEGPEREMLHDVIWGPDASKHIHEADVEQGDSLFIPKGWWHSVKSSHSDGRLNGSVNWWFR